MKQLATALAGESGLAEGQAGSGGLFVSFPRKRESRKQEAILAGFPPAREQDWTAAYAGRTQHPLHSAKMLLLRFFQGGWVAASSRRERQLVLYSPAHYPVSAQTLSHTYLEGDNPATKGAFLLGIQNLKIEFPKTALPPFWKKNILLTFLEVLSGQRGTF